MAGVFALMMTGCGTPPAPAPSAPPPKFYRAGAERAGVKFEHKQSRDGRVAFLPETLGPGVASLDYDGDGNQDLFWVQGSGPTDGKQADTVPPCALHRNTGRGDQFDEVGLVSGAAVRGWGQGVVACDLDNDGYQDLVITGYHDPVKVLLNNGDGTFRLVTQERGLPAGDRWWTSATAIDLDRDGLLDLYLGAYVKFFDKDWEANPPMVEFSGMQMPRTLAPSPFDPEPNVFLANRGGRFEDRTAALGLANAEGRTLAAMAADLDADGWCDLFVANDVSPVVLYRGGPGKPQEVAQQAMVSEARGSMGLALGDTDSDGVLDVLCTHWVGDIPAVFRGIPARAGRLAFKDEAVGAGFGMLPRDLVGWGVGFADVDRDGRDDVLIVNGHTNPIGNAPLLAPQIGLLMLAKPNRKYQLWLPSSDSGEEAFMAPRVGRSAAFTDLNSDGCLDVAVGNNNAAGEVWRHVGGPGSWLGLDLSGTASSRSPVGARVKVTCGGETRLKQVVSGDSYLSSGDPRLVFSTGAQSGPYDVEVSWPSGAVQKLTGLAGNRYHRVVEGGR